MKTIFAHAVKMNGKMVVEEVYRACSYDVQNQATLARTVEELIPRNCGVSVVAKYCMMLVLESSAASKEMVR